MKHILPAVVTLSLLTGCTTLQPQSHMAYNNTSSSQIDAQPNINPIIPIKSNYQLQLGNNPALSQAYNQYIKTGKAPNIITDGFVVFAYGNSEPIISASPFELTVITLEQGEKVTNVSSGDPLRWSYSIANSGDGTATQANIMVKPSAPNISTNLVITTDKRIYTLKIVSTNTNSMKNVRFWYPDEMQANFDNQNNIESETIGEVNSNDSTSNINLASLNFNYSISNSLFNSPSWKHLLVFDDGTHTYIEFPNTMSNEDMPALFIQNGKTKELVNYRSKPPYFVVDKIFNQAILVLGVGHSQSSVTITNNNYS
jgi:type IV secretion system protein VirB9